MSGLITYRHHTILFTALPADVQGAWDAGHRYSSTDLGFWLNETEISPSATTSLQRSAAEEVLYRMDGCQEAQSVTRYGIHAGICPPLPVPK